MSLFNSSREKENAFKELFNQYYAPLCIYAKHFINDTSICEDIVSDTFALIWEKFGTDTFNIQLTIAYAKICIKNACLNYLKHQSISENYSREQSECFETEEDIYTIDELYQQIIKIINELPPNYRRILWESFFENKTQMEIAKELNISVKSVGRYKMQILELLRKKLNNTLWMIFI